MKLKRQTGKILTKVVHKNMAHHCDIKVISDLGNTHITQCTDVRPTHHNQLGVYCGTISDKSPVKVGDPCQITFNSPFSLQTTFNGGFISMGEGLRCHQNEKMAGPCHNLWNACQGNTAEYPKVYQGKVQAANWGTPFDNLQYAVCVPDQ